VVAAADRGRQRPPTLNWIRRPSNCKRVFAAATTPFIELDVQLPSMEGYRDRTGDLRLAKSPIASKPRRA
jgi:hypothetical protein